jgi:outer membrane protein TolC
MDNIYKAVQLTVDSQNLALSKTPTHVYIANQYVDTNDTPLITAPFIIQKALENGAGVVDIVSSTIGSIYEVRLLCDAEGVATKADGLSVKVKVNEAEMTLTKVNDGLSLSRMLLCQLCGLDLSTPVTLADEQEDDLLPTPADNSSIDMNSVYATRPEVRSLELAAQIYKQKVNVTRSEFLPSVALIGNYMATNPSVFNSFENKFKGMWNVGVMVSIPVWHWGEGIYKVKAAKSEARISRYQLDDAKEKIELQVSQSVFKVNEAAKKLIMAEKNLEKADENLRYATLGFEEGVIPASNVLEAHTAWLSAQSEKIDAQIDVKLTEIYLKKATGSLNIEN